MFWTVSFNMVPTVTLITSLRLFFTRPIMEANAIRARSRHLQSIIVRTWDSANIISGKRESYLYGASTTPLVLQLLVSFSLTTTTYSLALNISQSLPVPKRLLTTCRRRFTRTRIYWRPRKVQQRGLLWRTKLNKKVGPACSLFLVYEGDMSVAKVWQQSQQSGRR